MSTRPPKDRDFVETTEGFFFCVVGYLHPPDRYTAYLKYTPASAGRWSRGETRYHRELPYYHVDNVVETLGWLERHHPRYIWRDPVQDLRFSFVPRDAVARYYVPEGRLAGILAHPLDPLERDVADLAMLLSSSAAVGPAQIGITGSVLLGIHDPSFSDIDLLIYGEPAARRVKQALPTLRGHGVAPVCAGRRRRWRDDTATRFGLTAEEVANLDARRWHYFRFRDRNVSVHATRADHEIREAYGERRYRAVGVAAIEATVTDASEALFLPAVYRVSDARREDGAAIALPEIACYEGLYCDVADAGDRIYARGALEEISTGSLRLVVGTAALPGGGRLSRIRES